MLWRRKTRCNDRETCTPKQRTANSVLSGNRFDNTFGASYVKRLLMCRLNVHQDLIPYY